MDMVFGAAVLHGYLSHFISLHLVLPSPGGSDYRVKLAVVK
jgi:hypothetical protein